MRRLRIRSSRSALTLRPTASAPHGQAAHRSGSTMSDPLLEGVATTVAAEGRSRTPTGDMTTVGVASIVTDVAPVGGAALCVASGRGVIWMYTAGEGGCTVSSTTTTAPAISSTSPISRISRRWSALPILCASFRQIKQPNLPAALQQELISLPDTHEIGRSRHTRHGCLTDNDVALDTADDDCSVLDREHAQRAIRQTRQRARLQRTFALGNERRERRAPQGRCTVLIGGNPQQTACVPGQWHNRSGVAGGRQIGDRRRAYRRCQANERQSQPLALQAVNHDGAAVWSPLEARDLAGEGDERHADAVLRDQIDLLTAARHLLGF